MRDLSIYLSIKVAGYLYNIGWYKSRIMYACILIVDTIDAVFSELPWRAPSGTSQSVNPISTKRLTLIRLLCFYFLFVRNVTKSGWVSARNNLWSVIDQSVSHWSLHWAIIGGTLRLSGRWVKWSFCRLLRCQRWTFIIHLSFADVTDNARLPRAPRGARAATSICGSRLCVHVTSRYFCCANTLRVFTRRPLIWLSF